MAVTAGIDRDRVKTPLLPATRAYALADTLPRGESGFSILMDLLCAGPAAAVREAVRSRTDPEQARIAALRSPDEWGEVWQAMSRLHDETEWFNHDKRQAPVAGPGLLNG